jgi:hypothetical protein
MPPPELPRPGDRIGGLSPDHEQPAAMDLLVRGCHLTRRRSSTSVYYTLS